MSRNLLINQSARGRIALPGALRAVGAIVLAVALAACSAGPRPSHLSVTPSAVATAEVASSQLSFERKADGGFTAEFVIHPNGELEARQIGVGYPNWEYQVGPRVAVRMTDDDGRLDFAPALSCPDPSLQAEMPDRDQAVELVAGTYDAALTVDQSGEAIEATLTLIGTSLNSDEQGNATLGWVQRACQEEPQPSLSDEEEAQLMAQLPQSLSTPDAEYAFAATADLITDPGVIADLFPGIDLRGQAVRSARAIDAEGGAWAQIPTLITVYAPGPEASAPSVQDLEGAFIASLTADGSCVKRDDVGLSRYFDCGAGQIGYAALIDGGRLYTVRTGLPFESAVLADALQTWLTRLRTAG